MDGWNTTFLLGRQLFRGYVKLREGTPEIGTPETGTNGTTMYNYVQLCTTMLVHLKFMGPFSRMRSEIIFPYHHRVCRCFMFQVSGFDELTLPETNIAPENGWLEYYFPIGMAYFQGLC